MKPILVEQDYVDAANLLQCEVAAVKAIAEVESAGNGFFDDGRPKILFEAHIFSRETKHIYDKSHPNISSLKWNKALYKGGIKEYDRLEEAKKLNETAALDSASWGKFQICGFNHVMCGYNTVQEFVNDMYISEGKQLMAFVKFCKSNKLDVYLRNKNWAKLAEGYNGKGYAQNKYDVKLATAYSKYKK